MRGRTESTAEKRQKMNIPSHRLNKPNVSEMLVRSARYPLSFVAVSQVDQKFRESASCSRRGGGGGVKSRTPYSVRGRPSLPIDPIAARSRTSKCERRKIKLVCMRVYVKEYARGLNEDA